MNCGDDKKDLADSDLIVFMSSSTDILVCDSKKRSPLSRE